MNNSDLSSFCTLTPFPGVGQEKNVLFDISRQKETRAWSVVSGRVFPERRAIFNFPANDTANDDSGFIDESLAPVNKHIYSMDGPGIPSSSVEYLQVNGQSIEISQKIQRRNFNEFVRVSFDGSRPSGNTNEGSRCSPKQKWHMFLRVEAQGATYAERPGYPNEVDLNHVSLDPAPSP